MARCGRCGGSMEGYGTPCLACGGTAIPPHAERGLQTLHAVGDLLAQRFRVERILGSGASGIVYGVHDAHTDRRVALKVLWERATEGDPALERLKREIKTAQGAPNPHSLAVYDLIFIQDHPAILMEWIEGETLRDKIKRHGPLSPQESASIAGQVLHAMALLHGVGIVHRDIKSGNVILAPDGTAKLGDFGLAKGDTLGATLTETGVALGTPGYMAPEVIRGGPATAASDLYSLGVMIFEMLTGRMPYRGSSALEVASRQLSEAPPLGLLKEHRVPRWLARVTARLLERDPADRFPSAGAAARAIGSHSPGFALAKRWRWRAAATLVILGLGLAAALWRHHAAGEEPLQVSFQGKVVEVRNSSGALLWTRALPQAIQSVVEGHFGPGGARAVACAIQWDPGSVSPYNTSTIEVFSAKGIPIRTLGAAAYEGGYAQRYRVDLQVHRFSRREHEKLVVCLRHTVWYPAALLVYSDQVFLDKPLPNVTEELSFYNSGSFRGFTFRDLDGDGTDEVVCAGVNNRLYRMLFAAALHLNRKSGLLDGRTRSPDIAWSSEGSTLFYRLFSVSDHAGLNLDAGDAAHPPTLQALPDLRPWEVGARGLSRGGFATPPEPAAVEHLNTLLPELCSLRDRGRWRDLEAACDRWPERTVQPYAWLGDLFRAHALMGQGRYAECAALLQERIQNRGKELVPLYAYQFWIDSAFLFGKYQECMARAERIPRPDVMGRPELGHTALWAAIYGGDPDIRAHILHNPGLSFFAWYPKMFEGVLKFLDGRPSEAETLLKSLQRDVYEGGDMDLWTARTLLAQGKAREALSVLQQAIANHPGEGVEASLLGAEARWQSGEHDPALIREADALLSNLRREAVASVETRAVLPLELASAARLHRAAGDLAAARRLHAEALRLAPKGWSACLSY